MPPSAQRHVRRAPLSERLKSYLHPADISLWLSEEIASHDWDEFSKNWSNTLGLLLNFVLIFARGSSGRTSSGDEIFEDYHQGVGGYFASLCSIIAYILAAVSFLNAVIALTNTKSYRLFHVDPLGPAPTPTARKVKINSSPASSNALSLLTGFLSSSAPRLFGQSDNSDEVWEMPIWDPPALSLRLFTLFSPANVIITWLFLPASTTFEQRASVTVAQTVALCALVSIQGHFLGSYFSQQRKDNSSIFQQVTREYDIKYVQPNAEKKPVRDVGIQFPHKPQWNKSKREWEAVPEVVSSPPYPSPRAFRTFPNPSYCNTFEVQDEDSDEQYQSTSNPLITPNLQNNRLPLSSYSQQTSASNLFSSPIRPNQSFKPFPTQQKPQYSSTGSGDGGSLGIYTNARSPLRKATSANVLRGGPLDDVKRREGSPLKRSSTPAGGLHQRTHQPRDESSRRESGRY